MSEKMPPFILNDELSSSGACTGIELCNFHSFIPLDKEYSSWVITLGQTLMGYPGRIITYGTITDNAKPHGVSEDVTQSQMSKTLQSVMSV
jgi:hypothetical protein